MATRTSIRVATGIAAALALAPGLSGCNQGPIASAEAAPKRRPDGRQAQQGVASYYAERFHGRRMANGKRFDRNSNSAAHRNLPLGTVARVTNLENGRSELVEIEDRGPYAKGRIIDLSPRTAERLEMRAKGTARVAVTPLEPPEASVQQAERR
jgi:rare lipoprotein A